MKNIFVISTLLVLLAACKSDDETVTGDSLQGTYDIIFIGGETPVDFNGDGSASANLIDESGCYQGDTLVFASGGNGTINSTSYADVNVIIDSDGNISYDIDCIEEVSQVAITWEINGNNVTLMQGFVSTLEGVVNGDRITFTVDQGNTIEIDDENGNGTITITEDFIIIYEKR